MTSFSESEERQTLRRLDEALGAVGILLDIHAGSSPSVPRASGPVGATLRGIVPATALIWPRAGGTQGIETGGVIPTPRRDAAGSAGGCRGFTGRARQP